MCYTFRLWPFKKKMVFPAFFLVPRAFHPAAPFGLHLQVQFDPKPWDRWHFWPMGSKRNPLSEIVNSVVPLRPQYTPPPRARAYATIHFLPCEPQINPHSVLILWNTHWQTGFLSLGLLMSDGHLLIPGFWPFTSCSADPLELTSWFWTLSLVLVDNACIQPEFGLIFWFGNWFL